MIGRRVMRGKRSGKTRLNRKASNGAEEEKYAEKSAGEFLRSPSHSL
jgi:hypothetical protein